MEANFALKVGAEVFLGEGRNDSNQESNAESSSRVEENAGASADYDSSCKRGPLDVLNGELLPDDGAGGEGSDAAASEGEDSVDDDLSLGPGSA